MVNLYPKLSIVKNIIKSVFNLNKRSFIIADSSPPKISKSQLIPFTKSLLQEYKEIINWNKVGFPPLFPYALSTHIHFSIVNDRHFPFSPYGLLHKKEQIWCKKELTYNAPWLITSFIDTYRTIENGIEFDLVSELSIDGELVWKSTTTAFKRIKHTERINKPAEAVDSSNGIFIKVPAYYGRRYAKISNNIDPIHISSLLAKLQGHKTAIMHGMWAVARALSEVNKLKYPLQITSTFKASIPIPSTIMLLKRDENNIRYLDLYSKDGKTPYVKIELKMESI